MTYTTFDDETRLCHCTAYIHLEQRLYVPITPTPSYRHHTIPLTLLSHTLRCHKDHMQPLSDYGKTLLHEALDYEKQYMDLSSSTIDYSKAHPVSLVAYASNANTVLSEWNTNNGRPVPRNRKLLTDNNKSSLAKLKSQVDLANESDLEGFRSTILTMIDCVWNTFGGKVSLLARSDALKS
jgi:hypothetical protein